MARAVFERLNFGHFHDNTASFKSDSRHKKAFAYKCQHCRPFSVIQMSHTTPDQLKRGQSDQNFGLIALSLTDPVLYETSGSQRRVCSADTYKQMLFCVWNRF